MEHTRKRRYRSVEDDVREDRRELKEFEGPYLDYFSYLSSQQYNFHHPITRILAPTKFKQDPEYDELDTISNQPDDVLLKIFSFLDRKSLDSVKNVSQKLNFFAKHSTLRKIKYKAGEIRIVQNDQGHAFHVRSMSPDEYSYVMFLKCMNPVQGPLTQQILKTPLRFYDRRFRYIGYHHQSLSDYVHHPAVLECKDRNHETPIPRVLFTKLGWILEKSNYTSLTFINVVIDMSFIYNVKQTFKGVEPVTITFDGAVIQRNLLKAHCRDLARWMLSLKPRNILIDLTQLEYKEIFNENFIKQMAASRYRNCALKVKCEEVLNEVDANLARFFASKSIISSLAYFHTICLHSMRLDVDWLVEAFKSRMNMDYCTGDWRFCVTGPFYASIHCSMNILGLAFEYEYNGADNYHVIKCKNRNNIVGFFISSTYSPGVHVVEAYFQSNPAKKFAECPRFYYAVKRGLRADGRLRIRGIAE